MATAPRRDRWKLGFFACIALCLLTVIYVDERFLITSADPEWLHIAPFQGKLLVHGVFGTIALLIGPFQFSDRIRTKRPKLHRWMGRIYIGAVAISAPLAAWIGFHFERPITAPEQIAQGGLWWLCTAFALACALKRQFVIHKVWMMRSYGFCLVFILSRVPDALPGFRWSDLMLAHALWWMIAAALVGPDIILTTRTLLGKKRRTP